MNIDDKIWHDRAYYYCEENNFDESATTNLRPGTEVMVYNNTEQNVVSTWFVSKSGKFIRYLPFEK